MRYSLRNWRPLVATLAAFGMAWLLAVSMTVGLPKPVLAAEADSSQGFGDLFPPPAVMQGGPQTADQRYPGWAYTHLPVDLGAVLARSSVDNPNSDTPIVGGVAGLGGAAIDGLASTFAGQMLSILVAVATITIRLVENALTIDLVSMAQGTLVRSTDSLMRAVYLPFLLLAVTLAGGWMAYQALVKREALKAVQGGGWTLGALIASAIYLAVPGLVIGGVNGIDAALSEVVFVAITSADPTGGSTAGAGGPMQGELAAFASHTWQINVVTPWSVALFGDQATGQKYADPWLRAYTDTSGQTKFDFGPEVSQSTRDWYHGAHGGDRAAIAFVALGLALLTGLLLVFVAGVTIAAQFGVVIVLALLPMGLLLSIHPGWGRRLFLRLAELGAALLLLRIFGSALLGVVLVLSGSMASIPNWGVSAALQAGLVIVVYVFRARIWGVVGFNPDRNRVIQVLHGARQAAEKRFTWTTSAREAAAARTPQAEAPALEPTPMPSVTGVASAVAAWGGRRS